MIYLIKSGDYLKIGYSQYPEKRIYELQIGNPEKLKILSYKKGGRWDEKSLHQLCKDYKYRGEWFRNCKEVIDIFNNYFIMPFISKKNTQSLHFQPHRNYRHCTSLCNRQNYHISFLCHE